MVSGINRNEAMLRVARSNPTVEGHQGSATDLLFPDGSFEDCR
jgi:hypothetical protein